MGNDKLVQLPVEIVMDIMSYLSVSDRMHARLVCKDWHDASLSSKYIDKEVLIVNRRGSEDNLKRMVSVLKNSYRPFLHFVFKEVELRRSLPIWDRFGANMRSLVLVCCSLSEKTLVEILKCCKNLRVLHINACRECLMLGRLLDDEKDVKEISSNFHSLVQLSLGSNRYLSDALFNRLVSICPNLQSLSLFDCQISFHSGLYKKFYPNSGSVEQASESVLTFINVLSYIKKQAKYLKHVNFGSTLIDGVALGSLAMVENLKLESLRLPSCDQLTSAGLRCLANQSTLRELDLSYCSRVTDASLVCISQNLTNLEILIIRRCRGITDLGISQLNHLRKLCSLDISECDQLTGQCIVEGLCKSPFYRTNTTDELSNENWENFNPNSKDVEKQENRESSDTDKFVNRKLESLSANALNLDEKAIECIAFSFPQLKLLDIGYCFSAVTDKTIQMIFKELVLLRSLRISRCDKVSDAGLTGMGASSRTNVVISTKADRSVELPGSKLKIRLGSRAEEDILLDAHRKREVMEMCEDSITPTDHEISLGFSLIRLRGIKELNLSGCNRVTDVSLKHAFKFSELRILDLSMCQQITHVGLDYLTKNNPAIEDLNLSQCHNVTDTGILYVSQRLHRLKRLHLQSCSQLTDHSLDSIKLYCKNLQYFDVRNCRSISIAGIESLCHLHVNYTEQRDVILGNAFEIPEPPLMRR
ncbi:F-box/LRR-repeat protein 20 isoform X2 [Venturia canescens]|uniref:F-box/LRR-repeat protein 20 isoform X2 n=1 Tax=Venturia canescens TaxID=32260 RepID=UPI001C9C6BDA|nr:F-box/LRR-repeat protein 20 isoform X2 [Venturia canescens]